MRVSLKLQVALVLGLVLIAGRGSVRGAAPPYRTITIEHGGTIRGTVKFVGDASKILPMQTGKDVAVCGASKPTSRLSVGKDNGVAESLIMIEGIDAGKPPANGPAPVISQINCAYVPHLILLPAGSPLEIVNADPILHNVHVYRGEKDDNSVFNIAQPIRGHHTVIKGTLFTEPGIYRAVCDAGHPWMSAYVVVTRHPYYAVTDQDGRFVLENVPPGSYKLKMWHEGVRVTNAAKENGAVKSYTYERPYEEELEITVPAGGAVTADFALRLR